MSASPLRALCLAIVCAGMPSTAVAQRQLSWSDFDVVAHLGADGRLTVTETQAMVFSGEWNGGERRFNVRPRQTLSFVGVARRVGGAWRPLTEDARLDQVDEFSWTGKHVLRWRSRLPSEPPFSNTTIEYQLRYVLSGILLKDGDEYRLDHDFAFPDRDGPIDRFALRLTFDPVWTPLSRVPAAYTAGPLAPGRSFVLDLPLRFAGTVAPATLDLTRPLEIRFAVPLLLGITAIAMVAFFRHEQSWGRFAPFETSRIDEPWLREHILRHPPEVVGAAWDASVGKPEVVALIARLVAEGKLQSEVANESGASSMTLRLMVPRSALHGYERTLVDGLFFDDRKETTTELLKEHYHDAGFDPARRIKPALAQAAQRLLPTGDAPRAFSPLGSLPLLIGVVLLGLAWYRGELPPPVAVLSVAAIVIAGVIAAVVGAAFRAHINWGRMAAALCLLPAVSIAAGAAVFLWFPAGTGAIELSRLSALALASLALGLAISAINGLRSRQPRQAIVFRRQLAAARAFFMSELERERPALHDQWYPWLLAFDLDERAADWSARHGSTSRAGSGSTISSSPSGDGSASGSSSGSWTGFGGGQSGGAGGGASWAVAASGMAAGVSAPSSGGGGSSGGGSSGGGGGGGW
jgi:hypothetical protein